MFVLLPSPGRACTGCASIWTCISPWSPICGARSRGSFRCKLPSFSPSDSIADYGALRACLIFNALETAGTIVWATAKQRHVPAPLLGRVSSLDWLISIGLLPLSFALTGPVSAAIGPRATLAGAGLIGGVVTFAALLLPGMRAVDVLRKKRDGGELSRDELAAFVEAAARGTWPDYQLSALLMAVFCRGMTPAETAHLTRAMADSGKRLDLSDIPGLRSVGRPQNAMSPVPAPESGAVEVLPRVRSPPCRRVCFLWC